MNAPRLLQHLTVTNDFIYDGWFIHASFPGGYWMIPFMYTECGIKTHLLHIKPDGARGWKDRLTDHLEIYNMCRDYRVTVMPIGKKGRKFYVLYTIQRTTRTYAPEQIVNAVMEWWG